MSGMLLLAASIFCGISVCCFIVYAGRAYERIEGVEPSGRGKVYFNTKAYPEKLRLYQWLVKRLINSRFSFIKGRFRVGLERLWERSGYKKKELPYFIAKLEMVAIFGALVWILVVILTRRVAFAIITALPVGLYWALTYVQFKDDVTRRIQQIERELPYILDLLAMMLYGGGNVLVALKALAQLPMDSPIIDEMRMVTGSLHMGKSLSRALRGFSERTGSETVKSVVLAVEQGERLGTPLNKVLKSQAVTIRNKRILNAEEQAQSAGVKVFVPASLVMLALMIVLLAPAIMKMFQSAG